MIDNRNLFDYPVKNEKKKTTTYDNIYKIAAGMEYDYATGYLLGYPYFKKAYKMISTE